MQHKKSTLILIHGAWHAKWCWKYIVPMLEAQGHNVINVDLPGRGETPMNFADISLQTYVDHLINIIQAQSEPVTLVGHSMAGVAISQVAEIIPEAIEKLIYVTAFIPDNGGSLTDEASKSTSSGIATEFIMDLRQHAIGLKQTQRVKDLFLNRCKSEDIEFVIKHLQKEPLRSFSDPIKISQEKFGKVKKYYIECLDDKSITIEDQRRMYIKNHCQVISIDADHSPFFSAPKDLVEAILKCN